MTEACEGRQYVLVTSFGEDRAGIVDDVTRWLLACGGNVEESRMARLKSEFAALILVSGPEGLAQRLEDSRSRFEEESGLQVILKPTAPPREADRPAMRYRLEGTALDHPGIVNRLAHVLRSFDVSIAEAVTHTEQAPFTSAPVFRVTMEVDIPASVPVAQLRAALARVAEADGIDVVLMPR